MASLVRGATNTADQGGCAHGDRRAGTFTIPAEILRVAITPGDIRLRSGASRHTRRRRRLRPTLGTSLTRQRHDPRTRWVCRPQVNSECNSWDIHFFAAPPQRQRHPSSAPRCHPQLFWSVTVGTCILRRGLSGGALLFSGGGRTIGRPSLMPVGVTRGVLVQIGAAGGARGGNAVVHALQLFCEQAQAFGGVRFR